MTDASLLRTVLAVAFATTSLVAAGCGGGDDDESGEASKAARSGAVSLQQAMDTSSRAIDEVRGTKSSLERLSSRLEPAISQTGDVVVLLTPEAADGEAEARLLTGARQQRTFLQYAQDAAGARSESAASSALRRARTAGRQASATYARVAREYPDLAGVVPDATSFNTGRLSDAIRSAYGSRSDGGSSGGSTTGGGSTSGGSTSGGGSTTSGTTNCGGGVSVNANTSCPFGLNVAETYRASGGATVIEVFSPVTDRTYTMTCTGAAPVVCRGGNNAVVTIR
jgi:hypothetical protein